MATRYCINCQSALEPVKATKTETIHSSVSQRWNKCQRHAGSHTRKQQANDKGRCALSTAKHLARFYFCSTQANKICPIGQPRRIVPCVLRLRREDHLQTCLARWLTNSSIPRTWPRSNTRTCDWTLQTGWKTYKTPIMGRQYSLRYV